MTREFWNKEYKNPKHLTLSIKPSADLLEFAKWAERNAEWPAFPKHGLVVDIGCGNGRNLVPLCHEYNMNGFGTDISEAALEQARVMEKNAKRGLDFHGNPINPSDDDSDTGHGRGGQPTAKRTINPGLKIEFKKQGAEEALLFEDQSVDVVMDMMVSHQLPKPERQALVSEIARVLKPYGWLFFKTFILEDDANAKRMIQEFPVTKDLVNRNPKFGDEAGKPETNSYIHPHTGGLEHVFTESEIYDLYGDYFKIYKTKKSYKHVRDGKPHKRRTISVYMERIRE